MKGDRQPWTLVLFTTWCLPGGRPTTLANVMKWNREEEERRAEDSAEIEIVDTTGDGEHI